MKRFSQSCERNRQPILQQLKHYFADKAQVLEIGSGTGQHAVYFAKHMPHLHWHTSDMPENHPSVSAWIKDSGQSNISHPISLTIGTDVWPRMAVDAVFTANTTHIMQLDEAKIMMQTIGKYLPTGGLFCQYGPMKVNGEYNSETDKEFDKSLTQKGFGGIRDIDQLVHWAKGMELIDKISMPANNFLLVWKSKA